jgi:hypothetical protein
MEMYGQQVNLDPDRFIMHPSRLRIHNNLVLRHYLLVTTLGGWVYPTHQTSGQTENSVLSSSCELKSCLPRNNFVHELDSFFIEVHIILYVHIDGIVLGAQTKTGKIRLHKHITQC